MFLGFSHILILISFTITLAHTAISHHHHSAVSEKSPRHHHDHAHSAFDCIDMDENFIPSKAEKFQLATDEVFLIAELNLVKENEKNNNSYISYTDHPPPGPVVIGPDFRGPPLV